MDEVSDDRYLKFVVARLGAYRNVWWSMANEFDFMKTKTDADWERFARVVADSDPYDHLLSIHNGTRLFNHTHPLLTHASIQNGSAVADFGSRATSSGAPVAITFPPDVPPSGPRSMTQSAHFTTSRLCSMTTIVLP